ncbi:MAG: DUF1499 domain-containing protein [Stellaceae bacterium]
MTSTTATPATAGLVHRVTRRLPLLALLLAIAAAVVLALGPLGWRAGWWHFRIGFFYLMPGAFYCALAAVALALVGLALGARSLGARQIAVAIIAVVIGGTIAYVPWHYNDMRGIYPSIHDITTDWENPPQFSAILPLREAAKANSVAYEGARVSDLQRKAYPDIAPLTLDVTPAEAFSRALDVARQIGWTIVASDKAAGRIEASQRTRWFGFTDDVVVRVTAAGAGSRVDLRSVSRLGRGDFGANATRVRRFLAAMRAAAPSR